VCDLAFRCKRVLRLVDNTLLKEGATAAAVENLCRASCTSLGQVAAVCVFPEFVPLARTRLQASGVKVATVVNFPHANLSASELVDEVRSAREKGADEVDMVFPWRALLAGDSARGLSLVQAARDACGDRLLLKVIIESGELREPQLIGLASELSIQGGADFLKTSTGKTAVHATPEAARVMLTCIRDSGQAIGFKASGGIQTLADAEKYLSLVVDLIGESGAAPARFRLGASSLVKNLLDATTST